MDNFPLWLDVLVTLLALLLAAEVGRRSGLAARKRRRRAAKVGIGPIQGAVFGLLALLLAFTYGFVSSRAETRRTLITTEANAIGTAYLRADLLTPPADERLRDLLLEYARLRIIGKHPPTRAELQKTLARTDELHRELWNTVMAGVSSRALNPGESLLVASINDVIDTHTVRLRGATYVLPAPVLGLLLSIAVAAIGLTTFGLAASGRRGFGLSLLLVALLGAVLLLIIDLDHPRSGLLRIGDEPLVDLVRSIESQNAR